MKSSVADWKRAARSPEREVVLGIKNQEDSKKRQRRKGFESFYHTRGVVHVHICSTGQYYLTVMVSLKEKATVT